MDQILSQNIQQDIDTTTYIVYGKMRNGKTLNAICMSLDYYPRIYSNVQIYKNGKSIVKFVEDYKSLLNIRFSYTPGVLIIDEAGLNANSKDAFTKENRAMQELLFLCGKKNLSLIWIAQRFESIDVNARVLADLILEMKKVRRRNSHPVFKVTKRKMRGQKMEFVNSYMIDSISIMKKYGITYNQLEESKMKKNKKVEEEEKNNSIIL